MHEDAQAFGVPLERREEMAFAVHPENVPALELWMASATQMRYSATGLPVGLDYAGVEAVRKLKGYEREVFEKMQQIEQSYLSAILSSKAA